MAVKYQIPRGTFDILPEESYKWQYLKNIFREITRTFNYKEVVTPIFEMSELFERSVGVSSDIVQKEMYKFKDKKGRIFALRPEGTAPIVRSYVANNLGRDGDLSKLFYMGPMFRYERPQKGRYRQHFQYGIENIGSENPYIDAEVIAVGFNFLKKLGLNNFELQINSIGCPNCTLDYNKALVAYFSSYYDELCPDCKIRIKKNPKRLLDCKVKSCKEIGANAPSMLDYLDDECEIHFKKVQENLSKINISFTINSRIVRGLDYYTKTAFEFIDNNLGAKNTLIGGGRYDGLVKQLGGNDIPGIGFAGGFERLIVSMEKEGLQFGKEQNPDVFLVSLGEEAKEFGISFLSKLRNNRISAEISIDKNSLKAQMKAANKSKAQFALILGENEIKKEEITLKNMETGSQELVKLADIVEKLLQILKIK